MIALFVLFAMVSASIAPLFVYTTTLALFGLAHVLVELRYVDARFGRRASRELVIGAALLLSAVVVARALRIAGLIGESHPYIEMGLVTTLGALALPALVRRGPVSFGVGVVVVGALGLGAAISPSLTLVILAVLHNATPIGFLAEASPNRSRTLLLSTLAFVGAPLVVASGFPRALLGLHLPNESILPAGPLSAHLFVYVPKMVQQWDGAVDAFAAVVCAQVLHYGAVIGLMPRRLGVDDVPRLPWPSWRGIAALSAGLVAHFAVQFSEARALYGLAASVHAWIEVPVLLLALTASTRR